MKNLSKEDFDDLQKFYRINLINSCTGYKSANLINSDDAPIFPKKN